MKKIRKVKGIMIAISADMKNSPFYIITLIFASQSCNNSNSNPRAENKESADTTYAEKENKSFRLFKRHKPLVIIIENLSSAIGTVRVGVYGPKNEFPSDDDHLRTYRFEAKNGRVEEEINDLEYGELAFAVFHDENNNGEIDKNGLGIPTEPYGFSNNVKPVLKAPEFHDCKFIYNEKNNEVAITLNNNGTNNSAKKRLNR